MKSLQELTINTYVRQIYDGLDIHTLSEIVYLVGVRDPASVIKISKYETLSRTRLKGVLLDAGVPQTNMGIDYTLEKEYISIEVYVRSVDFAIKATLGLRPRYSINVITLTEDGENLDTISLEIPEQSLSMVSSILSSILEEKRTSVVEDFQAMAKVSTKKKRVPKSDTSAIDVVKHLDSIPLGEEILQTLVFFFTYDHYTEYGWQVERIVRKYHKIVYNLLKTAGIDRVKTIYPDYKSSVFPYRVELASWLSPWLMELVFTTPITIKVNDVPFNFRHLDNIVDLLILVDPDESLVALREELRALHNRLYK